MKYMNKNDTKNDDSAATAASTGLHKKRPATENHDGSKKGRKLLRTNSDSDSVEQYDENDDDHVDTSTNKVASSNNDSNADSWIQPIEPSLGFVFEGSNDMKLPFVIYMAVKESKFSTFARGLQKCAEKALPGLHQTCFQWDQTRHVTLFQGDLTLGQARSLCFPGTFSPIKIEFDGWQPWYSGCYLKLKDSTKTKLEALLGSIVNLPPKGGKRSCDHLSLYRKRSFRGKANFADIRKATAHHDWGNVEGVSVRVKLLSTTYDQCIVLAGA